VCKLHDETRNAEKGSTTSPSLVEKRDTNARCDSCRKSPEEVEKNNRKWQVQPYRYLPFRPGEVSVKIGEARDLGGKKERGRQKSATA